MGGHAGRPLQRTDEVKNIIITVVAATAVIHGQMTLGMMLAVQYIIGQLNSPVEQLMNFFYSLQDVKISLERINEIHRAEDENGKNGLRTSLTDNTKGIDIEHIMFKYDPHALRETLDDVTIHIPEGKVTAIVGASGSGKTTLVKLMLGYYPVLEGKIAIGNTDINTLNKKWWRRQCGVVMHPHRPCGVQESRLHLPRRGHQLTRCQQRAVHR